MIRHITAFVLDRLQDSDEARVRCRVKWEGSRRIVAVNVGCRVNVSRWDPELQRCVPRSFHGARRVPAASINSEIDRHAEAVESAFAYFEGLGVQAPEQQAFREKLAELLGVAGSEDVGVFRAFDMFVAERGQRNCWTHRTYQKLWGVKNHLLAWDPDLSWEGFKEDGLYRFVSYLRGLTRVNTRAESGVTSIKDTTVEKNLSALRWFLSWADRRGLLPFKDYQDFKPKLQKMDDPIIFLEWEELLGLLNFEIPEEQAVLRSVRDVFCFCCFTSLRYSDVYGLRWADVHDGYIRVTTVKTSDDLVIELNDYSEEILGRYVDEAFPDDKVFPVLSNQRMNKRLKELCRLAGITRLIRVSEFQNGGRVDLLLPKWQLMSTHAGRRTFISNALMMGIPPNVVMRWTGHADYNSMKPYIAIADRVKVEEMSKFNKK
jgi:integrase